MDETPATRPSLLVRIRDPQDERAWGEFLEIYTPLIYQLARRKGFQDADAADLAQEVFRTVASAIQRWDPDPSRGSFRGWLFRIARNLMINALAGQGRQPRGTGDTEANRLLGERAAPSAEDSALFEAEYMRRVFAWAVERVRGEFREANWQAFWQTGVEGKDAGQVAGTLGMSVGAVYKSKSRVMARLRQVIQQVEGEA
ncbi:MAG TPA: sigma-70 family RNA polymerase sigma factor [Isosphaeraceae bacterium]|jgi:RNA polymerase sigma-70 factor (ECF subfamily)